MTKKINNKKKKLINKTKSNIYVDDNSYFNIYKILKIVDPLPDMALWKPY